MPRLRNCRLTFCVCRQKIRQDEIETEQKLAQFRREAELANQRREEAEKKGEREAVRLSKEATRRVLEAQNESSKAFTEVSCMFNYC